MISFEDFKQAEKNISCIYLENALPETPSWNDFIRAMDYKYNNPNPELYDERDDNSFFVLNKDKNQPTDIFYYNQFDPQYWNAVRFDNKENLFPQTKLFIDLASNVLEDKGWHIKALMNFVGNETKYSAHKDNHHVISWQCIGKVEYKIYDNIESPVIQSLDDLVKDVSYKSYILNPGDVIFMPSGVIHEAVVSEPRATLILDRFENFYALEN